MLERLNLMSQNDHHEINFSETYMFRLNFEMKNDRLKGSGWSKCDRKSSQKIKRAHQVKPCGL